MIKLLLAGLLATWLAGCANYGTSSSGPSAGTGSIEMYGVIDEGIQVRK